MKSFITLLPHSGYFADYTNDKKRKISKLVFIIFWTVVLAFFERYFLNFGWVSVFILRIVAVVSNLIWLKLVYEREFWGKKPNLILKTTRMITVKGFVNSTNFLLLAFFVSPLLFYCFNFDIGIHFTAEGFIKKLTYITVFAVVLTFPYENILLVYLGLEIESEKDEYMTIES